MIEQSEILRRRDMRDVFTFTIDPADAKDFDDALSFEIINQGEASNKDEVSNKNQASFRAPDLLFLQLHIRSYVRGTDDILPDKNHQLTHHGR